MSPKKAVRGKLVAFEGIDRAGKSSVLNYLPDILRESCRTKVVVCGERKSQLSDILRNDRLRLMSAFMKTFLFATDRAWTYEHDCLPALEIGDIVLWDRYVDSAIVYRKVESSLGLSNVTIDFVKAINSPFMDAHLSIFVDISVETSLDRSRKRVAPAPYDETFLTRVRKEYDSLSKDRKDYVKVDGERPIEEVAEDVSAIIQSRFPEFF